MSNVRNNERLELPPEAEPARDFIEALVSKFTKRIDELEAKVGDLQQQLAAKKTNSRNSSKPPGSEHPHAKPARKTRDSKNKQGGQKGHKRTIREPIPTEQCDLVVPCHPDSCRGCGGDLQPSNLDALRHQVWELPPIKPLVTEYQLHRGHCSGCGITTCGELPAGTPSGQCGPRLAAFTGLLMGHFRQSKRRAAMFLGDLLNIPCCPAWTVKIQNLVSDAIEAPWQELRDKLDSQKQLFVDESPTKEKREKTWLWVAVASTFTVFGIFANRKRESLKAFIGDYQGIILNCDRAKMYFDGKRLQWCWAHLKRDIQKMIDSGDGQVKRLGNDLIRQQKLLFQHWRRYRCGEIRWSTFQKEVRPIRKKFDALLLRGVFSGNENLVGICDELYTRRQHLWTFTRVEGIEPTNNPAERALRPAVIYRKLSFGTQSASGSRYLERILTVSETCRQQGLNAYQFLIDAMEASFASKPAPSLVPKQGSRQKQSIAA
jgi:transposase